ncbi:hypothetical protein ACRE_009100 [Hapsidospora chrysogenum ATCC 11550]|uniref:Uncharacterized protein n=1 Tax=Hapsidospora chrysogenum (strain ATCC 11550 / CBS 779.69 / DSM 880 / IAM 14645 / JCM 23072 / IMI 49137) TaxID=857340 RepID=A0A086TG24_HAPC1|nr:hypothetical protein ACRE_009100 [Hapsidospora chrysogenum ATCC 11550]
MPFGLMSCPESNGNSGSPSALPAYTPSRIHRDSQSQPRSPAASFASRLVLRLRSTRIWRSFRREASSSVPNADPSPRVIGASQRRGMARETGFNHTSEASALPTWRRLPYGESAEPLALAGVTLAAEDLDRLSSFARQEIGKEKGQERLIEGRTVARNLIAVS